MNNTETKTNSNEIESFKLTVEKAKEIKDGLYPITIDRVTLNPSGQFGPSLVWYVTAKVDGSNIQLSALTGANLTVGSTGASRAYTWVKAISGKVPVIGEDFDFNTLKGKTAQGMIKNEEKDGRKYAKLKDIIAK